MSSSNAVSDFFDPKLRREIALSLCLAVIAGWVDVVAYLHWHGPYVSFMSGNSTHLMSSMSAGAWKISLQLASILLAFIGGVIFGELVARLTPRHGRSLVLLLEALLLGAAAARIRFVDAGATGLLLLACALGTQNASVHRTHSISLAVTYVTGTLVHLGQGIVAAAGGHERWTRPLAYLLLWLALVAGAAAGAALERHGAALAIGLASIFVVLLAAITRPRVPPASPAQGAKRG